MKKIILKKIRGGECLSEWVAVEVYQLSWAKVYKKNVHFYHKRKHARRH